MIFCIFLVLFAAVHGSMVHEAHHPQPYNFGYSIKDREGAQHRQEAGNRAGVHGNYGYTDNKGRMRQVDYVADHHGFRAQVKTNEPGTAHQSPAAVHMISNRPRAHEIPVPYVSMANYHDVPALRKPDDMYGMPTHNKHREYSPEHRQPSQGYKFITPVREIEPPMPSQHHSHDLLTSVADLRPYYHMPASVDEVMPHYAPVHMPSPPRGHHMPNPETVREHYMTVHVPVQYRDHHMPEPVHNYVVPHHIPVRHEYNVPNMDGQGYNHHYRPSYMGGLAYGNILGAGYRGYSGLVSYNTNLKGGAVRGYDSRLTSPLKH